MTATIQSTELEDREAILVQSAVAQLEEFLRDPIGHGSYDFADPVTLDEFTTTTHYRGLYTSLLV